MRSLFPEAVFQRSNAHRPAHRLLAGEQQQETLNLQRRSQLGFMRTKRLLETLLSIAGYKTSQRTCSQKAPMNVTDPFCVRAAGFILAPVLGFQVISAAMQMMLCFSAQPGVVDVVGYCRCNLTFSLKLQGRIIRG